MSKRFGRTQKRKMLERIKNVEHAMGMNQGLLRNTSDKLARLRKLYDELVEGVEQCLGENTVLLPSKSDSMGVDPGAVLKRARMKSPNYSSLFDANLQIELHYDILHELEVRVEKEEFQNPGYHILIDFPNNKRFAYFVSKHTFDQKHRLNYPVKEQIIKMVVHELGHALSKMN